MRCMGLNPCFNGILKYKPTLLLDNDDWCLNPCFNGILKYFYLASKYEREELS